MTTDLPLHLAASTTPGGMIIEGLPENLVIRQFYLGCLSQAAYLVGDRTTGRAIAVDPRRDITELLAAAEEDGLAIEYVMQTHFHADFLSGHLEVAAATGAVIGYGAAAVTEFESRKFADGEVIDLGGATVEIWETPGHTPESISLIVRAQADGDPVAVLTGDALFIGDVGRPDLLVAANVSAEELGAKLYNSVHRLAELPETTLVLPAHGAGSACGKSLSSETVSTIGAQRVENYALAPMTESQFIDIVTEGQPTAPGYFSHDASLNRKQREVLDDDAPVTQLAVADALDAQAKGVALIDVRPGDDFARAHLANTLSIPLGGRFAEQVGMFVDPTAQVILLGDPEATAEARVRMARIGFDAVIGAASGVEEYLAVEPEASRQQSRLTAAAFRERVAEFGDLLTVIDVRNPGEIESTPVEIEGYGTARNIPLAALRRQIDTIDADGPVVVYCAGGARSQIASSVLAANGFDDVSDIVGGANALGAVSACQMSAAAAGEGTTEPSTTEPSEQ